MIDLRVRTAGPSDFPSIAALEPGAEMDAPRLRFLRRSVNANECYVAERANEIVAFSVLNYTFFENGYVAALTVSESVRYTESVIALLRYMEARCRTEKLFASALESNTAFQNALRKIGYQDCGKIDGIDGSGCPLVFVTKLLEPDDNKIPEHHFGLG